MFTESMLVAVVRFAVVFVVLAIVGSALSGLAGRAVSPISGALSAR